MIPKDSVMLLSFVNTQLRDKFNNLDDFCKEYNITEEEVIAKLENIDYIYSEEINQFI